MTRSRKYDNVMAVCLRHVRHSLSNPNKEIYAPIAELGERRGLNSETFKTAATACLPCSHVIVMTLVLPSSAKHNTLVMPTVPVLESLGTIPPIPSGSRQSHFRRSLFTGISPEGIRLD